MGKETTKKGQEPSYEEVLARLEEVVRRLEAGNLPLEESLRAFEEGVSLVRAGEARLQEAEKRVEQLLATPSGNKIVQVDGDHPRLDAQKRQAGREPARETPPEVPADEDIPF